MKNLKQGLQEKFKCSAQAGNYQKIINLKTIGKLALKHKAQKQKDMFLELIWTVTKKQLETCEKYIQ